MTEAIFEKMVLMLGATLGMRSRTDFREDRGRILPIPTKA